MLNIQITGGLEAQLRAEAELQGWTVEQLVQYTFGEVSELLSAGSWVTEDAQAPDVTRPDLRDTKVTG